jgi:hypothetical protein
MASKIVGVNDVRSNFAHVPGQAKQGVEIDTRILGQKTKICALFLQGAVKKTFFP